MTESPPPRTLLPPRLLPVLYFASAHVALALAFASVAADPRGASGFFYHARMLGIVHLVTLGWITASILGSLYIVAPIALRMQMPAGWLDYAACAGVIVGVIGMVAHFWVQEYAGMAWSAMTVGAGVIAVGVRAAGPLRRSPVPRAVKAHIALAFANILAAATLGILIGFDKVYHFLPGFVLTNVFAHAHLAALGWATMMVVGVAYRLLPMVLPSAMPGGWTLWISAVFLQTGATGLFVALLSRASVAWIFALLVVAGLAAFLAHVVWMIRHRRPPPARLAAPDPAVMHAGAALLWLVVAAALGVWLTVADASESALRVATAYGVFGLVGFLSQMVIGMEGRLLPLFAAYWAFANSGYDGTAASPYDMPWRGGQDVAFVLWLFGVPALAVGLGLDAVPFVRAGAWCLLIATLVNALNAGRILRHAFGTRRRRGSG